MPTCLAHGQRIAGQAVPVPPVVDAGVERTHVGHVYVWQHVFGSIPEAMGVAPSGHAGASVGHAFGAFGSQVGFAGTHCPAHVEPLQFPCASQAQVGSPAGHAQVDVGTPEPVAGSVVPVAPTLQPQPVQDTWHIWPVGQSVSALQPVWMFGVQTPKQSDGQDRTSHPHEPSAFSKQRPVGPAVLPSAQT